MDTCVYPKHYVNIDKEYNFAKTTCKIKPNKYGDMAASLAEATSKALIADGENVDAYFKKAVKNTKFLPKIAGVLTALVTLFAIDLGIVSKKYQLSKMNDSVKCDCKNNRLNKVV